MNVTHLISNIGLGGAEGSLCTLIESQAGSGVNHTVISMLPNGLLAPRLEAAGAKVLQFPGARSLRCAALLPAMGRAIAQSKPNVVQAWMYHGNLAASLLALGGHFRSPVLWGVRQSVTRLKHDSALTRLAILAGAPFAFQPQVIIYNSSEGAASHERLGYSRRKTLVIPNGIDCARFVPRSDANEKLRFELGLPEGSKLIGRVARFAAMKDFGMLFRSFALVRREEPLAHLLLVGPSVTDANDQLIELWKQNGAPAHVHYLGPRPDVETFYAGLDAHVSTSASNEGFANAIFEAIACGVPSVATEVGNSAQFQSCLGVLAPAGDAEAVAHALIEVLRADASTRARRAEQARAALIANFGTRTFSNAFANVWEQYASR